jgi:hypothetical protein
MPERMPWSEPFFTGIVFVNTGNDDTTVDKLP